VSPGPGRTGPGGPDRAAAARRAVVGPVWLVLAALVLAGCAGRPTTDRTAEPAAGPFAACTALTAAPGRAATPPAAGGAGATGPPAPAATGPAAGATAATTGPAAGATPAAEAVAAALAARLPCFADGAQLRLADLRGPAVVNLWASWCAPCRAELPAFQRYADRAAGRVHVVGVITEDTRRAAGALAEDLGVRFPALVDRGGEVRRGLGGVLPITLFLDAAGRVRHVHTGPALDDDGLAALARRHLAGP